ncbi:ABC transporter, ATP-binding protein [mine drainage metagenome]|uniref:ABC transporter, ATP-binding protein n=1 Tax=mine drainage metagenome TaxID=410659 RepID=T1BQW1_9ZZZZ
MQANAVASQDWALELSGVTKSYGSNPALVDGTFAVHRGEIFGLLGPNGAGKTTLVEILLGIKHRDSGSVRIMGVDPERAPRKIRELISGQLQISPFQDKIRVLELLDLFASLYPHPRNIHELLDLVGLTDKKNTFCERLSGGQKQRLALALALVGDADLVVLDEPTTGLDAQIRRELHEVILELSRLGKTLLLTTHYIEEAEKLCARVAILFRGRVHAVDTPQALIAHYTEGENLEVTLDRVLTPEEDSQLQNRCSVVVSGTAERPVYRFHGSQGERLLVELVLYLNRQGIGLAEARIRRPSLEEAYLAITGSRIDA